MVNAKTKQRDMEISMSKEQYTNCDELFDDDGKSICDGDKVLVNGEHVGKVYFNENHKFHIEDWPIDNPIESLEVIQAPDVNIDNIHPMIKE
jgi:hypothetical protein